MRKLLCLTAVLFSIFLLSGVCYPDDEKSVKEFSDAVTIKPGKFHEKCVTLRPLQVFDYKFGSSSPVYFNIHYHGEYGREYLIEKHGISSLEETITEFQYKKAYTNVSKRALLCMLWKNNTEGPVELSIECTTRDR